MSLSRRETDRHPIPKIRNTNKRVQPPTICTHPILQVPHIHIHMHPYTHPHTTPYSTDQPHPAHPTHPSRLRLGRRIHPSIHPCHATLPMLLALAQGGRKEDRRKPYCNHHSQIQAMESVPPKNPRSRSPSPTHHPPPTAHRPSTSDKMEEGDCAALLK